MKRTLRSAFGGALVLSSLVLTQASPAQGAIVPATGTNPSICNQTVSNAAGVVATRLAGGDCVIEFKNVGTATWTAPYSTGQARVLVVAGGGGGGAHVGGGGGAGGVLENTNLSLNGGSSISITVGGGGTGAKLFSVSCSNPATAGITGEERTGTGNFCNDASRATRSLDGGNSIFSGSGTIITSLGGGGGGSWNYFYPHNGGSGGGSGNTVSVATGTAGQGSSGGAFAASYGTGGGGGASANGGNGSSNTGGNGGAGISTTNYGTTARSLAGGGGGGTHEASPTGAAGSASHGGGAGRAGVTTKAFSGTANTGGGGGGSGNNNTSTSEGGDGGSGIILVRYTPDTTPPSITSSTSFSFAENSAISVVAANITFSESATSTLLAPVDGPLFNLTYFDSVTVRIKFNSSPDFENRLDSGGNNIYDLVIQVNDGAGNSSNLGIAITVTNVNENSNISAVITSGNIFKGVATSISLTINTPGKVIFFVSGKRISGCLKVLTTGSYPNFTATCSWKPTVTGRQNLTATFTPSDNTFSSGSSGTTIALVTKRSTFR